MAVAHVTYHYDSEGWWAEYPGYSAFGSSLDEVRLLAQEGLRFYAEDSNLVVVDPFAATAGTMTTATVSDPEQAVGIVLISALPMIQFGRYAASQPAPVRV
jgi:predicted RNase H-like HicB family nuclease